jgi:hypothetical protein
MPTLLHCLLLSLPVLLLDYFNYLFYYVSDIGIFPTLFFQILVIIFILSCVLLIWRLFDWFLTNSTPLTAAPIECGFDASSNKFSITRMTPVLTVVILFEIELILIFLYLIVLLPSILLLSLLCVYGFIEIYLAGK